MQADSGFPRYLKSNMDRFIAISVIYTLISIVNLKSNMDRFIEVINRPYRQSCIYLKSNMDRFIV